MLQAAIDESFEPSGVFVLAGYVATAEGWEKFSATWQKMLRHFGTPRGVFRLRGTKHFMRVEITFNEDQLTKNLIQAVRQQIDPKREIVDLKTKEVF